MIMFRVEDKTTRRKLRENSLVVFKKSESANQGSQAVSKKEKETEEEFIERVMVCDSS